MMDMANAFDLTGRAVLVTGGGSGIGKGCAKVLAQAGASVMVVGRRMGKLEEVRAEIEAGGGVYACFSADLTDEANCKAMVEGMDAVTLFRLLGHATPSVTLDKYGHALNDHKRASVEKLGGVYSAGRGIPRSRER